MLQVFASYFLYLVVANAVVHHIVYAVVIFCEVTFATHEFDNLLSIYLYKLPFHVVCANTVLQRC